MECMPEKFLFFPLREEPCAGMDLTEIRQMIANGFDGNIGLNLSEVDVFSGESISKLLALKTVLDYKSRKLVLYSVSKPTLLGQFTVLGINGIFSIAGNREEAKKLMAAPVM